ncbi:MAG TPA: BMP family ABC transporter substrate-binding protein, partial [Actinomycetota bacterium]|nr:BMP family ABC transporter substrate-binding protein [Actinomycetota bacterium]
EEQRAAMQVFLRLVHLGHGTEDARRRVPVSELTALELDPVALSEVLERFGRHRLLSFDRDAASGHAIVEVAHEALLWEWERLAGWIQRYRTDLSKHDAFLAAVDEWEASGRDPDYLLRGSRLSEYETWSARSTLRLTADERAFLLAGLERRRLVEAEESSRQDQERRLERRARTGLMGLVAAVVLLAGTVTYGALTWLGNRPPDVVFLDSRGSGIYGDSVASGLDHAVEDLGIRGERWISAQPVPDRSDLLAATERGYDVVIATQPVCQDVDTIAREHPETRFLRIDCPIDGDFPNVASVTFASEQGSYLAGAAAAMKSETGVIGFVGAWDAPFFWAFQAGYEAGARAVDPDIEVRSIYLSNHSVQLSESAEPIAFREASRMYEDGADVIFAVAHPADFGVFEAARQESMSGVRHVWAIGASVDMYDPPNDPYYPYILTSMVTRLDVAVYALLEEYTNGELRMGFRHVDLKSGGVGITYSGGYLDEFRPRLEALEEDIASGAIEVPCVPDDRMNRIGVWGIDPSDPCAPVSVG